MRASFLWAVLVVACRAGVVTFNETLFHVTLAGTFPPRPSCVLDRDVHLLTGQVDPTLGGTVRVHVANGTVPDYNLVFGPAIADRGFLVHNVTAELPCSPPPAALTVVRGYAGCEDPSRGPAGACLSIAFQDDPSPDVPPHYHWLLSIGVNPPLPPVVCSSLYSQAGCDAHESCLWCTSVDGGHALCFAAGRAPAAGWACG